MEESIWMYFGIIMAVIALGIVVSLVMTATKENNEQAFFDSIGLLGNQADVVCDAPENTMLSLRITTPAEAILRAEGDRICGSLNDRTRCVPTKCTLSQQVLLDLTGASELFSSHEYVCTVLHASTIEISCAG